MQKTAENPSEHTEYPQYLNHLALYIKNLDLVVVSQRDTNYNEFSRLPSEKYFDMSNRLLGDFMVAFPEKEYEDDESLQTKLFKLLPENVAKHIENKIIEHKNMSGKKPKYSNIITHLKVVDNSEATPIVFADTQKPTIVPPSPPKIDGRPSRTSSRNREPNQLGLGQLHRTKEA